MIGPVARLAVGPNRADIVKPCSTGTGDKLTDAFRIGTPLGILRREPFINMVVARDYNVNSMGVEQLKQSPHMELIAMSRARAE